MSGKTTPPTLRGSTYRVDLPGTALQTLIAPASNVAGVVIYAYWCIYNSGPSRLMAKSAAPTAWSDAAARTIGAFLNQASVGRVMQDGSCALPIILLPGEGLYFQGNGVGTAESFVDVNAEIL